MKTIEAYTEYLFNGRFTDDDFDPDGHEDHLNVSEALFEHYDWAEIYPVWMHYLHTQCVTPEDVINFVNLYYYYGAVDHPIPDALAFMSYLYYKVDMDQYWDEAGDLFDSVAIVILSHQGLVDIMKEPSYNPLRDERILSGISALKNGNTP